MRRKSRGRTNFGIKQRGRSSYKQYYEILTALEQLGMMKVYMLSRELKLEYYQCQKRILELVKAGAVRHLNGDCSITKKGIELRKLLEALLKLFHNGEG